MSDSCLVQYVHHKSSFSKARHNFNIVSGSDDFNKYREKLRNEDGDGGAHESAERRLASPERGNVLEDKEDASDGSAEGHGETSCAADRDENAEQRGAALGLDRCVSTREIAKRCRGAPRFGILWPQRERERADGRSDENTRT